MMALGPNMGKLNKMKKSTKITSVIIIFFLIISVVIIGRTMIGNHFTKKYSKRSPPGIIVTKVMDYNFSEKIESFGTAIPNKTKSFRLKKNEIISNLNFNKYFKKGEIIVELENENIVAPFSGILGKRGLSEDVLGSESSIIITLDDSSVIYSDLKIPETFASFMKVGLPIEAKFSGYKNKTYEGEIDGFSSRINADTRSLLTRVKINNENFELIPGSLLEVIVKFNQRISLAVPDTSIMLEGNKAYVYKITESNTATKTEIKIGTRNDGFVEIVSGLNKKDIIAAEGLKKVRPNGKIKPINK
jgi:membrane fusion protein, multidrug efflux system